MMEKIYLIFDYFKDAFHINRENKVLYKPQLILIAAKLMWIIGIGIGLYFWVGGVQFNKIFHGSITFEEGMRILWTYGINLLGVFLSYLIISRMVEAGLYNMYKYCVTQNSANARAFWEGVNKYFFKFLMIDMLVVLGWIVFSIFYLIASILTLSIGFTVIPMVISIFLTMWKVSMVMNDCSIFTALKNSLIFAKGNFIPLGILQLIHWSFIHVFKGSSGNIGNSSDILQWKEQGSSMETIIHSFLGNNDVLYTVIKFFRIMISVLIPIITIATAIAALIKMVFEVFFSLTLFVVYQNAFQELGQSNEEVVV